MSKSHVMAELREKVGSGGGVASRRRTVCLVVFGIGVEGPAWRLEQK
jgi:hypothetical protein